MSPPDLRDGSPRDRILRLCDLTRAPNGYVQTVRCRTCGHLAALPVAALLKRFGELTPIDRIRDRIPCSVCQGHAIEIRMMRLCDPGCPRQRG